MLSIRITWPRLLVLFLFFSVANLFAQGVLRVDDIISNTMTVNGTTGSALDVAGGVNAGSANVGIIGTDGRIPAVTSTYFASLNYTVPVGMVAYFTAACPAGWTDLTASYGGYYLVAAHAGQTLGTSVGTVLTAGENRPAGQHTHPATSTDAGHTHQERYSVGGGATTDFEIASDRSSTPNGGTSPSSTASGTASITTTTSNPAGSVAGTPAPYRVLTLCWKQT